LEFRIGDSIINGDGVRKMLGILNSPALISVAKDAGQAAATITTNNITNMWSRMWIGSRKNACWFVNQDVEPQLLQLSLGIGTAGVATYLPPGGLSGNPYGTLLGRPVIATEFNATLGTVGDIMLADLSMFVTGSRGGMQSAVSMHVYFSTMENLFRFSLRLDGRSWWLKSLTPYKGTATKSPFIVLATRS
jgi:HK97 family phage major capsid protein